MNLEAGPIKTIPVLQLGAALQTSLPQYQLPQAELGTLNILLGRIQAESVSAATPHIEAAPNPERQQAVLASIQDLRAQYTDDALKNLPAGELNLVAQKFFDRVHASVSGTAPVAEPAAPSVTRLERGTAVSDSSSKPAPEPQRKLYLLSKPLEVSARLGPVAQGLHYFGEIAWQLGWAYVKWKAGLHLGVVVPWLLLDLAKAPGWIATQSMMDLQARYWWTKLKTLKELARIPGVERITVLTGTETHFNKVIASRQDNRGLIFLESSKPLREMATLGHGAPLMIEDPGAARIKLSLEVAGSEHPSSWTPTLQDLLDKKPIPREVADDWRKQIHDAKKDMTRWRRFFDMDFERNLKVHAVLVDASGSETPLGVLSQGQSTKKLLGITRLDLAARWLKAALGISPARIQTLFSQPSYHPERGIPLGDTTVERPSSGASWRDLPSRVWRRLLGRLIVADELPAGRAPSLTERWRSFKAHYEEADRPIVDDPRAFFSEIYKFGLVWWTDLPMGNRISLEHSKATARRIAKVYFEPKAPGSAEAMEGFIERVFSPTNLELPSQKRKRLLKAVTTAALLPAGEVADFFRDSMGPAETQEIVTRMQRDSVTVPFLIAVERLLREKQRERPGYNVVAVLKHGSRAGPAPAPDSDLDIVVLSRDGTTRDVPDFLEALEAERVKNDWPRWSDWDRYGGRNVMKARSRRALAFYRGMPMMILTADRDLRARFTQTVGFHRFVWDVSRGENRLLSALAPIFRGWTRLRTRP